MPTGTIGTPARAATNAAPSNSGWIRGPVLAFAFGEQHERLAAFEHGDAARQRLAVGAAAVDRERAERREQPAEARVLPHLLLAHEPDAPGADAGDDRRVDVAAVHRREHVGAGRRQAVATVDVQPGEGLREPAHERAEHPVGHACSPANREASRVVGFVTRGISSRIVLDDLVDRQSGRVDDDRVGRLGERAVGAGRVLAVAFDDRCLDVGDVAADLGDTPFGAHPRRRGDEQLERRVGKHDRADVAPSTTPPPCAATHDR